MVIKLNTINGLTWPQFQNNEEPTETSLFFGNHGIKLHGRIILPSTASVTNPVPGAVLTHGIGSDNRVMESSAYLLAKKGIAAILVDIRGHGKSEGRLDDKFYEDVVDAWQVLTDLPVVDRSRIALIGHSLGAFASILATTKIEKPKALIALSCPYEVNDGVLKDSEHKAFPLLKWFITFIGKLTISLFNLKARIDWGKLITSWSEFSISSALAELTECSKLFVFSEKDPITPFQKFAKLYEEAPSPKQKMVTRGSHVTSVEAELICYEWVGWTVAALNRSEMVA